MLDFAVKVSHCIGYDPIFDFDEKAFFTDENVFDTMDTIYNIFHVFGIGWADFQQYFPDIDFYTVYDPLTAKDYFNIFRFFRDCTQFKKEFYDNLRQMIFAYRRENEWLFFRGK